MAIARSLALSEEFGRVQTRAPKESALSWLWDTRFGTASSLDIFSQYSVLHLEEQGADVYVHGKF